MKKNKIISAVIASLIFTSSMFTPIIAGQNVNIKLDGMLQPMATDTINKSGYTLVGMRSIFDMIGAEVDWNSVKRCVTAKKDDTKVTIYVDNSTAVIEKGDQKENVDLPTPVEIIDSNIMIPLRFISEVFDAEVSWDVASNIISIEMNKGKYDFLNVDLPQSSETKVYTFEEALAIAKKQSSSLKTLSDTSEYLKEVRDDLGQSVKSINNAESVLNKFSPDESSSYDDYLAYQLKIVDNIEASIQVIRSIKNTDTKKSLISANTQMAEDGIEVQLRSYITDIRTSNMQKSLLERSIELGKENISNMELKYSLGLESEYKLTTEKNNQKTNESKLETLKLNIENQNQALKTLLGLKASDDVYIEYDVKFDALNDIDLEPFITKKTQSDPSILMLKADISDAEYAVRTNAAYVAESTLKVQNDLKAAQRALKDAQDQMEKNIRTTYNTLKQLEENDKVLKLALEQAKIDYNSAVASYLADSYTIYQVNQAKLGILSAEKDLEENALNYATLAYSFERPYLLSSK